jgi:hypothetical protein
LIIFGADALARGTDGCDATDAESMAAVASGHDAVEAPTSAWIRNGDRSRHDGALGRLGNRRRSAQRSLNQITG